MGSEIGVGRSSGGVGGWGAPVLIFHLLKLIHLRGDDFRMILAAFNVFLFLGATFSSP